MAPLFIFLKGLLYPIIDYQLKYPGSNVINYAKGELEKLKIAEPPSGLWIGRRFLSDGRDEKGEYDIIYVYLGNGWFKFISKVY